MTDTTAAEVYETCLEISVQPRRISRPAPSAGEFVRWIAAGAPTTRHRLSLLSDDDRDTFLDFVEKRLEAFRRGEFLELPTMRHVFAATNPTQA